MYNIGIEKKNVIKAKMHAFVVVNQNAYLQISSRT